MKVTRYDNSFIQPSAKLKENGFLEANAIVTRVGVFTYRNPDGTERKELRSVEEVLNSDSLESMKMIPVTNNHPIEKIVSAENAKRLQVGYTGQEISEDSGNIFANFVVTDENTVKEITENNKNQLSLGYTVELIEESGFFEGERFDFKQTNIRYNHLAIVDKARAGDMAKINLDENDAIEIGVINMSKVKIKLDDDLETYVDSDAELAIESFVKRFNKMKSERKDTEEEIKELEERLEKLKAERDALKDQASELEKEKEEEGKNDSEDFKNAVKERIKLIKHSETILDSKEMENIHDVDNIEIKKMVIKKRYPKANLDGKEDVYIQARYDSISEETPKDVIVKSVTNDKEDKRIDADKSRSKMIEEMKDNWKNVQEGN